MHPDPRFRWEDRTAMRAFVAETAFGALFAATPEGPRVVHLPAVWLDETTLALHVARSNRITPHLDGATALFVVQGPDAYVSPDWYGIADQVPTWNYLAVELEGRARRMTMPRWSRSSTSSPPSRKRASRPSPPGRARRWMAPGSTR